LTVLGVHGSHRGESFPNLIELSIVTNAEGLKSMRREGGIGFGNLEVVSDSRQIGGH
jgi:hypothetical protein